MSSPDESASNSKNDKSSKKRGANSAKPPASSAKGAKSKKKHQQIIEEENEDSPLNLKNQFVMKDQILNDRSKMYSEQVIGTSDLNGKNADITFNNNQELTE